MANTQPTEIKIKQVRDAVNTLTDCNVPYKNF